MSIKRTLSLLAALAAFVSAIGQSGEAASVSATINAAMDRYESFLKKRDPKGVEATIRTMFSKSFVDTGLTGKKMTLEQFITQQKSNISTLQSVTKIDVRMADVKVNGSNGSGKGSLYLEAVLFEPTDKKKTHKLKVQSSWNSTFKKVNGKWWIVADKTIQEKAWLDGKPLN